MIAAFSAEFNNRHQTYRIARVYFQDIWISHSIPHSLLIQPACLLTVNCLFTCCVDRFFLSAYTTETIRSSTNIWSLPHTKFRSYPVLQIGIFLRRLQLVDSRLLLLLLLLLVHWWTLIFKSLGRSVSLPLSWHDGFRGYFILNISRTRGQWTTCIILHRSGCVWEATFSPVLDFCLFLFQDSLTRNAV